MIQRIQSVYLMLVVGLLIGCMLLPIGIFGMDNVTYHLMNYGMKDMQGVIIDKSMWALIVLLIVGAIIAFCSIFMFKKRVLQIRMTIFNTILLLGYYVTLVLFVIKYAKGTDFFTLGWGCCLPLICMILNILIIRAIGKDEFMVRAAERLR